MEAMVENGEEWMEPMLEFRDWLASTQDPKQKHKIRDVRRRDGRVHMWAKKGEDSKDRLIWGPFLFEVRKDILRRLLHTQRAVSAMRGEDIVLTSMRQ